MLVQTTDQDALLLTQWDDAYSCIVVNDNSGDVLAVCTLRCLLRVLCAQGFPGGLGLAAAHPQAHTQSRHCMNSMQGRMQPFHTHIPAHVCTYAALPATSPALRTHNLKAQPSVSGACHCCCVPTGDVKGRGGRSQSAVFITEHVTFLASRPVSTELPPVATSAQWRASYQMNTAGGSESGSKCKRTGVVKWFSFSRGYGFITQKDSDEEFFVHQVGCVRPAAIATNAWIPN